MLPVNASPSDDSEEWVRREPDRWSPFLVAGILYAARRSHFSHLDFPFTFIILFLLALYSYILFPSKISLISKIHFNFSGSEISFPLLFTEELDFDLWPYLLSGKGGLGTIATS